MDKLSGARLSAQSFPLLGFTVYFPSTAFISCVRMDMDMVDVKKGGKDSALQSTKVSPLLSSLTQVSHSVQLYVHIDRIMANFSYCIQ